MWHVTHPPPHPPPSVLFLTGIQTMTESEKQALWSTHSVKAALAGSVQAARASGTGAWNSLAQAPTVRSPLRWATPGAWGRHSRGSLGKGTKSHQAEKTEVPEHGALEPRGAPLCRRVFRCPGVLPLTLGTREMETLRSWGTKGWWTGPVLVT